MLRFVLRLAVVSLVPALAPTQLPADLRIEAAERKAVTSDPACAAFGAYSRAYSNGAPFEAAKYAER